MEYYRGKPNNFAIHGPMCCVVASFFFAFLVLLYDIYLFIFSQTKVEANNVCCVSVLQ